MPLPMRRNYLTFLVHVLAVVWSRIMIEKAHQRTVSHQRHNALCLIVREFQPADPEQHNDEAEAQQAHAKAVEFCRLLVNALQSATPARICANGNCGLCRHYGSPLLGDRLSR